MLDSLLARAVAAIHSPTISQQEILARINELRTRLGDDVIRVAVLGQFKRGKSTLLNALLGSPLLPVGVTPITAIPTFIRYGEDIIARVTFQDGKEPLLVQTPSEIPRALQYYVSESENALNRLNVKSVELEVRSEFLARGILLVDTPGVGSTLLHNTQAAEAILPQCDAAIFVTSADPPITEVECTYLRKIRRLVPKLYFVLNKIDLLTPAELIIADGFLKNVLKDQAVASDNEKIFLISARKALEGGLNSNSEAVETSGVASLMTALAVELAREKHAIILATGLRRSTALVHELLFQSELEHQALLLPQEKLEEKLGIFNLAANGFDRERQELSDFLAVDRKRLISELEAETDKLWDSARRDARRSLEELAARTPQAARDELTRLLSQQFDTAFQQTIQVLRSRLVTRLSVHQERASALITLIRQGTADLMEIPAVLPEPQDVLETRREPYWVAPEPSASLSAISTGALSRLLPQTLRNRYERKQLISDTEAAVLRNIANLEWAVRQNIEEAFRRFEFTMTEQMTQVSAATRQAIQIAIERRNARVEEFDVYVKESSLVVAALSDILKSLQGLDLQAKSSAL